MTPPRLRLPFALACCLVALPAQAVVVGKVEIQGLADEAMQDNVRSALSLQDETGDELRKIDIKIAIGADLLAPQVQRPESLMDRAQRNAANRFDSTVANNLGGGKT